MTVIVLGDAEDNLYSMNPPWPRVERAGGHTQTLRFSYMLDVTHPADTPFVARVFVVLER